MTDQPGLQNVEDIYPLTPMQQGMLLEATHQPESLAYFEQFTFVIRGTLDVAAYRNAWETVIDRHAVLRSQFLWQKDERPLQVVMKKVTLPWEDVDWSGQDDAGNLSAFLEQDRETLFRLNKPPLMRMTLAKLGPESHRLIWTFHHILVDAWSVSVILNDVQAAYEALAAGERPEMEPPARFRNAIAAMEQAPKTGVENYWRELLDDFDSPTALPAIRSDDESAGRRSRPAVTHVALEGDAYEHVKTVARENRVTLSTMLLGAWGLVLARCGLVDDVVFGATFSGRSMAVPDVERMVGLLMNAAPVRVRLPKDVTVGEYLSAIQRQVGESTQREQTSLMDVQRWSSMPARAHLFNSIVVFGNYPLDESRSGREATIEIEAPKSFGWTTVPLTLMVTPWKSFDIEARYDAATVDPDMVQCLLDDALRTMQRLAGDPARSLDAIEILDEAEQQQLLAGPNTAEAPDSDNSTIHGLFAEQAARSPNAVAYACNGRTMTYAQLDRLSAGIAARLQDAGVAPGSLIGVCIDPSPELPAALLGVMRAGCCYVPMDPTYPTARLEHIVNDAEPPFVLAVDATLSAVPRTAADVIDVGTIEPRDPEPAMSERHGDVAYVIYTSGSTGQPKGVRGTHRGAVNRFRWMWSFRPFAADEVACWRTTINFVDHVWEVFGPLLAGVPVEILPPETVKDTKALVSALKQAKVTRLVVVPSLLEALLETIPDLSKRLPRLRLCVTSGEALSWSLASDFLTAMPGVELLNLYGSSEVAADVAYHVVTDEDIDNGVIPIGRPVAQASLALLDERLHPTPPGVPGIIHVGGAPLADGYHKRPELTAERFVDNPHPELTSHKLFCTGDLARWNAQGELEFLGRVDGQVKIRGSRVELGEVECTLAMHPVVAEAAVVCRETSLGTALHAYIVPHNGSADVSEVRRFVRGRLPEYMVPSAIMALDEMPRTPNGKLDRNALPEPSDTGAIEEATDETTQRIIEIFQGVLGLPRVGACSCFFDLGGHSLLAVKLTARLEDEFKTQVPLVTLLRASTPRDLSRFIDGDVQQGDDTPVVALRASGDRTPFFCVHGMDGNILFLERLLNGLSPEQPLYGIMARGVDGSEPPLRTVEEMADAYVRAIRTVQPHGPYLLGGYSLGGMIALEIAHRFAEQGEEVARIIMFDTRVPRAAGGRSLGQAMSKRLMWHLRRGPVMFLKTLYLGPVERNAWRILSMAKLPMPRRLRPWPVRLASLNAYVRYRPRPWGGAMTLLRAEKQEDEFQDLNALGWERFARGDLDVHPLACDHLDFFGRRTIGVVTSELDRILEDAQASLKAEQKPALSS